MKYNLISFSGLLATYFAWHYEFDDDYDNNNVTLTLTYQHEKQLKKEARLAHVQIEMVPIPKAPIP